MNSDYPTPEEYAKIAWDAYWQSTGQADSNMNELAYNTLPEVMKQAWIAVITAVIKAYEEARPLLMSYEFPDLNEKTTGELETLLADLTGQLDNADSEEEAGSIDRELDAIVSILDERDWS